MRAVRLLARLVIRTLIVTAAVALVFAVLLHLLFRPDSHSANQEQYAVYSSYIEDGLTGDSHSLGDPRGLVLIFANTTMSTMAAEQPNKIQQVRFLAFSIANLRRRGASIRLPVLYNFFCSNLRSHKFERRFVIGARYTFLESAADYFKPNIQQRYPESYGFLSLSSVAFSHDMSEALFYAEHVCGLCGGGEFVLMKKTNGAWSVAERYSTWVS